MISGGRVSILVSPFLSPASLAPCFFGGGVGYWLERIFAIPPTKIERPS
jgi:hypothetical protein